jgi:putative hydrolase of the HAD superfamily
MLKAITFDFWNTLYDDYNQKERDELRVNGIINVSKQYGLNCSYEQVKDAMEKMMEHFRAYAKTTLHDFPSRKQVEYIFKTLGLKLDKGLVNQALKSYEESALKASPILIDGVSEIIKKLSKNYKLGIICNTGKTPGRILRIILKNDGLFNCFSTFTFSDEVDIRKPHKKIFEITLHNLNVEPKNALHVGDMYESDVVGAMNVGMRAILFDRTNSYSGISNVEKFSEFSSLEDIIQKIS